MTAWYNYILIATFEGLKQPSGLKQPQGLKQSVAEHQFSVFKIVTNCYYVRSAASLLPNDYLLINKVGNKFNT